VGCGEVENIMNRSMLSLHSNRKNAKWLLFSSMHNIRHAPNNLWKRIYNKNSSANWNVELN